MGPFQLGYIISLYIEIYYVEVDVQIYKMVHNSLPSCNAYLFMFFRWSVIHMCLDCCSVPAPCFTLQLCFLR